jgi:hypothetical protein
MAKKTKSPKTPKPRARRERRFEPQVNAKPSLVYVLGSVGALAMGAGGWEQFGSVFSDAAPEPLKFAPYLLTLGAAMVGGAIWIGTSGEPALRVGDAGVAIDKGTVRRMPWYAIEAIDWRDEVLRITGKDDAGVPMTVLAALTSHPQAGAWIVKEARARVPAVVNVPADATLPEASTDEGSGGDVLPLEALQVVGKHCAASGKVISYEPDARICPRCERIYHRSSVPASCECGASLTELQVASKPA